MELHIKPLGVLLLLQIGSVFLWDTPKIARPGQFPHLVSIDWSIPPHINDIHSCSGAILNELWVLSSGYCLAHIPIATLQIKAGFHNISHPDEHVQIVSAAKAIVHKKYAGRNDLIDMANHDIGLIKLTSPLVFNDRVRPIQLPRKSGWFTGFKLSYNLVMSGWGSIAYSVFADHNDVLRTVVLPIIPNKVCLDSMRQHLPNAQLHETQLCTRPLDGTNVACIGDYGGPLIQYKEDDRTPIVVGILTWSWSPCNTFGIPPVYTRVAPFVKWIEKKIKENS